MNINQEAHYTNAPRLHPTLLLGSLQLFFWLFFHPSAWRNHLARIEPTLKPNFTLSELSQQQWQQPALKRIFLMAYLIWPLMSTIPTGGLLLLLGESALDSFIALIYLFTIAAFMGLLLGMTVSVAVGTASGTILALMVGIVATLTTDATQEFAVSIIVIYIVIGIAGSLVGNLASQRRNSSPLRRLGGSLIGIFVGIMTVVILRRLLISIVEGGILGQWTVDLANGVVIALAFGGALGLRRGVAAGLQMGLLSGMAYGMAVFVGKGGLMQIVSQSAGDYVAGILGGVAGGILFVSRLGAAFALSYTVANQIADSLSGAIAGAVGGAGKQFSGVSNPSFWLAWPFGLLGLIMGFTQAWWRPVLLYPLMAAWNTLLYRADEQRPANSTSTLRWHSAFWDEQQRLPLLGLDDHLVLVMERNPAEAQLALAYLNQSHQRWAATAAQIELDARQLERCAKIKQISHASDTLSAAELKGPASALLRSFRRISKDVLAAQQQTSSYHQRLALSAIEERLDSLLRELTRSSERLAVRFRPIATSWHHLIALEVQTLSQTAEQNRELDNPYVFGVPLTEKEEIFVGRSDISVRIEQLLLDRRRPPLLLYGQRRMGKTSLLRNLGRLLPSTIVPFFVDGERIAGANDYPDFLYNIAQQMSKSAERQRNLILPPLSRELITSHPFTSFNEWLDEVEDALERAGHHQALLALDEFEALDTVLNKKRFDETDILRTLRHLIQHRPRFKVLLSGSHTLKEFERWASYLINVQVIKISYLQENEARQLIEQPIKGFSLQYEPTAIQRVLELTCGYPHLVQLLCYEIIELKNEQPPNQRQQATLADVEAAIPNALNTGSFFFADIEQNQVTQDALALLQHLAAQGEGATIKQKNLPAHLLPSLKQSLTQLQQRDLIEATPDGYRFQVELIRRWFA